jgi:hypothetical protein
LGCIIGLHAVTFEVSSEEARKTENSSGDGEREKKVLEREKEE